MKLKTDSISLESPYGEVTLSRNEHGVPVVSGETPAAMYFGQGWVQMNDRQLQAYMLKILFSGRAAECLGKDLIGVDEYMRRFPFLDDIDTELAKLSPESRDCLSGFVAGMNGWLVTNRPYWEWKIIGYRPELWTESDVLIIANAFGFIGLADAQGTNERFILQLIRNGCGKERIRELFPGITDDIDFEFLKRVPMEAVPIPETVKWLGVLPNFRTSNNWAVSGGRSVSGSPLFAGDPHLQIDRLPAIWQEIVLETDGRRFTGFSIPGIPGPLSGRTPELAWGPTYSCMDQMDLFVEEIRDGKYRRGDEFLPLTERIETILVKGRRPVRKSYFETDLGLLEGYSGEDGVYLCQAYAASGGVGGNEVEAIFGLFDARNVKRGMTLFKCMEAPTFNWVLADSDGHIGYQMSGRTFRRPKGVSGLVPLPAMEERYRPEGYLDPEELPAQYDPPEGLIVTANEDRNAYGKVPVCTLPMPSYRADRIRSLLERREKLDLEYMQSIQTDLYSPEAERLMPVIEPYLPESEPGRIFKEWDFRYDAESKGAVLFERIYKELIFGLFGDDGMGRKACSHLWEETGVFNGLHGFFDDLMVKPSCSWFDAEKKERVVRIAVEKALGEPMVPFGEERRVWMRHIFFGGKLPAFLGFDRGPYFFPGSRATVNQGQFYRSSGRNTSFCPSFRLVADMGGRGVFTNLVGGVSDRRFSKLYVNDLDRYMRCEYKEIL